MLKTNSFVKNAFIIRPFGKKDVNLPGKAGEPLRTVTIDFDRVEADLIGPALTHLGIRGRTTMEIVEAGDIREDMFHRLLIADLVIADLTIHNANVFYELGLRHAFRNKHTFLIRSEGLSEYPFDLKPERYFAYQAEQYVHSLNGLVQALKETIFSEDVADSPVYRLLPQLQAQDHSRFLMPPLEFREAIKLAQNEEDPSTLRLLAIEAEGYIWEIEGLRQVGRAQFELSYYWSASLTWEMIRNYSRNDLEANLMLARAYQRIYEHSSEESWLLKSAQALDRVKQQTDLDRMLRAEVRCLIGHRYKSEWRKSWEKLPATERLEKALSSGSLRKARQSYERAFNLDLNNYNAGLNALALAMTEEQLAGNLKQVWDQISDSPETDFGQLTKLILKLTPTVAQALEAERRLLDQRGEAEQNFWLELNEALYSLLVDDSAKSVRLRRELEEALRLAPPAWVDWIDDILDVCEKLELFTDNVKAARSVFRAMTAKRKWVAAKSNEHKKRILLFAGQRYYRHTTQQEQPQHVTNSSEVEDKIRQAIRKLVKEQQKEIQEQQTEIIFGISGGAAGSELIFQEVCQQLGIKTHLYLATPRDHFVGQYVSVLNGATDWVERFNKVYRKAVLKDELSDSPWLPGWLQAKQNYDLRRRSGLWMLQNALINGLKEDANVTLIALWDGVIGHDAGEIGDLVSRAHGQGVNLKPILLSKLLG